jgi:hypothetical protein
VLYFLDFLCYVSMICIFWLLGANQLKTLSNCLCCCFSMFYLIEESIDPFVNFPMHTVFTFADSSVFL